MFLNEQTVDNNYKQYLFIPISIIVTIAFL